MRSWSRKNVLLNSKLQTDHVLKHLLVFSVVKEKSAVLHGCNRIGFLWTRSYIFKAPAMENRNGFKRDSLD